MLFLPDVDWSKSNTGVGLVTPAALDNSQAAAGERQATINGLLSAIPVIYGQDRVGGMVATKPVVVGNLLYALVVWCLGEIDSIVSVTLDDKALPSGVIVNHYTGTQTQNVDATIAGALATLGVTWTSNLRGIAYSVFAVPAGATSGFPRFNAVIKGMKVYDPRDGTQTLGTRTTYKWSDNPSLAVADWIVGDLRYGCRWTVDWTTVSSCATWNDTSVGSPGEKYRTINLTITEGNQQASAILDTIRTHAGVWTPREGSNVVLIADKTGSSVFTFTDSNILRNSLKYKKQGPSKIPTVMKVFFTDTTVLPYREIPVTPIFSDSGVQLGTTPWREQQLRLTGVNRYSQAIREGITRLNQLKTNNLSLQFTTFDLGILLQVGDIVTCNFNGIGISVLARITGLRDIGKQRYSVTCQRYDSSVYDLSVVGGPTYVDTTLPSPNNPPTVAGLVLTEELYALKVGVYSSRVRATWTRPSNYPFITGYRVEVVDTGTGKVAQSDTVRTEEYATPSLQELNTYAVNVYVLSTTGVTSPTAGTANITPQGKFLKPSDVPFITGFCLGGETFLSWGLATDIDLFAYEIRYGPTGGSWAAANLLARVAHPQVFYRDKTIPAGTWRFWIKALDSVRTVTFPYGQESVNATFFDMAVALSPDVFVVNKVTFTGPAASGGLTNMTAYTVQDPVGGTKTYWITDFGDLVNFGSTDTNNSTGTDNDALVNVVSSNPHTLGASTFMTDVFDAGQQYTGQWVASVTATAIFGNYDVFIDVSATSNTGPWTAYNGAANTTARWARIRIVSRTTADTFRVDGPSSISLNVDAKNEQFDVTTLASGGQPVKLAGKYTKLKDIQVMPVSTTASLTTGSSREIVHPQSGLSFGWDVGAGTGGGSQDAYAAWDFWTGSRTLLNTDFLEYDIFIDPSCPAPDGTFSTGGTGVKCTGVVYLHQAAFAFLADANGVYTNVNTGRSTRTDALEDAAARGTWVSRKMNLSLYAGAVITGAAAGGDSDSNGTYRFLIRNVRITDGAGTDRLVLWTQGSDLQGEPTASVVAFGNGGVNAGGRSLNFLMGPSNVILVWAYTSNTAAQVVAPVKVSVKGI